MPPTSPVASTSTGLVAAYAFADRQLLCLRSQLPLIDEKAPTKWIHVAYEGEWHGHASGSFELTRDNLSAAVANHERNPNPVKLDFDHETEFAPLGAAVPARGWVHELELRDDDDGKVHLWALVEFGAEAVKINRDGGYRFCSAVFDFGATDRVSGMPIGLELTSIGLTDDPFILGQEPIRLSRRGASGNPNDNAHEVQMTENTNTVSLSSDTDKLTALYGQLGIDAEALSDVDKANPWGLVFAKLDELTGQAEGVDVDVEVTEPESEGEAPQAVAASDESNEAAGSVALMGSEEIEMLAQSLMEQLGVDEAGLLEMLQKLAEGGSEEEMEGESAAAAALSRKAAEETVRTLTARVETAEAQLREYREREADEAVGALIESGRMLDTGRETFRGLYLSNRQAYDGAVAALPEVVPLGGHANSSEPPTQDAPGIDESNPRVKSLRRRFSHTSLSREQQDAAIRKALAKDNARV